MSALSKIFLNIKLRNTVNQGKTFVSWGNIKTIALIVDSKTASNKSVLDKFIYESDKVIDVYYINLKTKQAEFIDYITLIKSDSTFFGLPNSKAISKLSKNYDVLINASFEQPQFSSVLSNEIKAKCKAGTKNLANELNLIITRTNNSSVIDYLNEVVKYLKMIKN